MTTPPSYPMPDGGPGRVTYYPPGSAPVPLVVQCAAVGCPSALAMPAATTPEERAARLTGAGWRTVEGLGHVCADGHGTEHLVARPRRRRWWRPW